MKNQYIFLFFCFFFFTFLMDYKLMVYWVICICTMFDLQTEPINPSYKQHIRTSFSIFCLFFFEFWLVSLFWTTTEQKHWLKKIDKNEEWLQIIEKTFSFKWLFMGYSLDSCCEFLNGCSHYFIWRCNTHFCILFYLRFQTSS